MGTLKEEITSLRPHSRRSLSSSDLDGSSEIYFIFMIWYELKHLGWGMVAVMLNIL